MVSVGFPYIADEKARVLVLGSLPGQMSLHHQQYYAHPRNAFWRIMSELFEAGLQIPYLERAARLVQHGIALWDVCAAANRPGSLDSDIQPDTVVPNDFTSFFKTHPQIEMVCCNGGASARMYQRLVIPQLHSHYQTLRFEPLPSTSPAHAGMTFQEKLQRWSVIRLGLSPHSET
jgi:double-stranded uracil-DNA glycosylase